MLRLSANTWWGALAATVALLVLAPAVSADSLELVQTIALKGRAGKLDHLALDAKRERLMLANTINNTLDIIDLKSGKLLESVKSQQGIQGVAYAPDLDRVIVGLQIRGFCNIFDGENYKLLKSIKFEDDSDNVRYHQPTQTIYVAHAVKALGVIDAKSYELKADIKMPNSAEGFALEKKRPRIYVSIPTSPSEITVVDTSKNEVLQHYPVKLAEGGHPVALDEANHRLFIGCRTPAAVVVMDTETGREISSVPIPKEIDDLFYDAGRKQLIGSCGEGFLVTIKQLDANRYEVSERIATAKGARTSLLDAEKGRLYLAVPRQEGKDGPEIRVYQIK